MGKRRALDTEISWSTWLHLHPLLHLPLLLLLLLLLQVLSEGAVEVMEMVVWFIRVNIKLSHHVNKVLYILQVNESGPAD